MKGLELAEQYFFVVGAPMIQEQFPDYEGKIAGGLVGVGSECFGFDDEISRDHDWGPTFCLWLTKLDYEAIGARLQDEFDNLPRSFASFGPREESAWGKGRSGVFEIGQFYKQFIGLEHPPQSKPKQKQGSCLKRPQVYEKQAAQGKSADEESWN